MIGPCLTGQSGGEEEEKKIGKGIAYVKERMNEEKEKKGGGTLGHTLRPRWRVRKRKKGKQ